MDAALLQDARMAVVPRLLPLAAALIIGGAALLATLAQGGPAARMAGAGDALSRAQAELARWGVGAAVSGASPVGASVDGPPAVATVVALRGVADPVARAQAELAGWALTPTADASLGASSIDATVARSRVEALRALADPVARAQAELAGWAFR